MNYPISNKIRKFWAYLGIILMMVLNLGPFFSDLKITDKAQANASTTWTKYGSNPVVNSTQAAYPRVIKDGSTYKMWVEENATNIIRYATSADGITWSALQNAKDNLGADLTTHEISVIKDDDTYKMWANEFGSTKYRTSADGINWSTATTVTYDVTKAWDNDRITPFVFKDGSTYKMYYNASEGAGKYYIAYATSTDGTSWTEPQNLGQIVDAASGTTNNNLVLKQGSSTVWDGNQSGEALYQMHILKNTSGTYEMWYGGNTNGTTWKIGYATSTDGITWAKSGANPILSDGGSGEWDDTGVLYPTAIEDGSTYKMWFTNNWSGKVGYATSTNITTTSPWSMFHRDTKHTGQSAYNGPNSPQSKWSYLTGGEVDSSPAIAADGTIYVGSADKKLYALNPDDGTPKWTYLTGGIIESSPAIAADGTIYVGSADKKLYALNPDDGTPKWTYLTGGIIESSPAIAADGTIYVGSADKKLYALNPDGTPRWSYTTGDWVKSSPAIAADGTIYVGSNYENKLYALNPDGTFKWSYTTGDGITSSPAIAADGTVYIGSYDGKLYALNPADGSKKWSYTTGDWISSSPAIASDGTIYVGSWDNKLYALNPADGSKKWSYTTGDWVKSSPVIASNGTIYVGSYQDDKKLYALNPDGTFKWSYTTGDGITSSPAIASDGTVYVGSSDRKLYALEEGCVIPFSSITSPATATYYKTSNIPSQFQGTAKDGTGGTGLNANSTTFYIQRTSDSKYWTGTTWSATQTWLATTHSATTDSSEVTWTSSATLPTWNSGETYKSASKATNKTSQTYTSTEITYYYDSVSPTTASVTTPSNSGIYGPSTMPSIFLGSVADDSSGFGLNANSSTFYLQNASNNYWTGSAWSSTQTWLATTHLATSGGSSASWQDNITLPTWSNGAYNAKLKAADKAGNTYEGSIINFEYTDVSPDTATVTAPANGTYYKSSTMPTTFTGSVADGTGGKGLDANSATFYIKRTSDNHYWNGTDWNSTTAQWLTTTHDATTDNTSKTWTDNITLPTWSTGETYKSAVKAVNKAGQSYTGSEVTYYYDSENPATASVTTPSNGSTYNAGTIPATFLGSVADGSSGFGVNANSTSFYIKRSSDNKYWNGTDTWTTSETWLATTHSATTGGNSAAWTSNATMPTWYSGTYYSKAKVTDKAGNTYQGSEISYIYSATDLIATVTTPSNNSFYKTSNMPAIFQGQAADSEGAGLSANSTLFYIKRTSDNHYWNGTDWNSTTAQWLATSHLETNDNTEITWTSDPALILPTWTSGETYYSAAKATNKNSTSYTGSSVIYFYDSVVPQTASVTTPSNSGIYGPSTMPSIFLGSVADDSSGFGLNANSSTFYLQNASNNYWTGSAWSSTQTWLATTHLATTDGSSASWQDNITLPTWSNGAYNAKLKAADKAGNTYEGSIINFEYTDVSPDTATVTAPANGTYYKSSTMPTTFTGNVADGTGGKGLNADSATFYIKRTSDNHYWNGTDWNSTAAQWLATTHDATTDNTSKTWTDNITLPTWSTGETYKSAVKAINKAGQSYTGSEVTYYYDTVVPTSTPVFSQTYYNASNWPGSISGTASDSFSGVSQVNILIKRNSDNAYWSGTAWDGNSSSWLTTVGTTSWSYAFSASNLTSDVSYTVESKATDIAGNIQSSYGSASFTYDNTAPSAPTVYDGTVAGQEISQAESLTTLSANWTASTDPGSGIDHYEYSIGTTQGGTDVLGWTNNSTATSVTKSGLTLAVDQTYYIGVRAVNGAGTTGSPGNSSGQTVVDHTPPVVTIITYPPNPTNSSTPGFAGTSVDAMTNIVLVEYKVDSGLWISAGTNYGTLSATWSFTTPTLTDGSHTVYVRSTDSKTNTSNPVSYTFTIDTTIPPVPVISSPAINAVITTVTPTFTGTASANTTILLTVYSSPKDYTTTTDSNGNWTFTVPASDALAYGEHRVVVKARNAAGSISGEASATFTISPVTTLPVTGMDQILSYSNLALVLAIIMIYVCRYYLIYKRKKDESAKTNVR